jgi:hypothetical protein
MNKIRCVVEQITYQNPENGYSVLKCWVKDYSDLVPVVGNLLDANVGSVLLVDGKWKVDAKYGRQFIAENWEDTLPATVYGMEKYHALFAKLDDNGNPISAIYLPPFYYAEIGVAGKLKKLASSPAETVYTQN